MSHANKGREEHHRVVIIGSGLGGSITAFRLAEAGIRNVVLERGRRWPITPTGNTFPRLPSLDRHLVWLGQDSSPFPPTGVPLLSCVYRAIATALPRSTGLLEVLPQKNVVIMCGAGVGGSTLVYGGVLAQPAPGPFHHLFPAEIDYGELDRIYYPRARRRLIAAPFPEDLLAHDQYRSNRLWHLAAQESGLPAEQVMGNYDFDVIRAELNGDRKPAATVGQYHFTGCNSGAKMSVDRTYLARAEATGKTVVRPLHMATGITQDSQGRYRVCVTQLTRSGAVRERLVLICDKLVLAAGVQSPRMLVTARDTGALPRLLDSVGAQWGTNGDQLLLLQTAPQPTCAPQGGPPAVLLRNREGTASVMHAPLPVPSGAGLLACIGMGISDHFGRWAYSAKAANTRLEWSAGNDITARHAVGDLVREVARHFPSGAIVIPPVPGYSVTAHPVGGVVLGKATDAYGRLHGYSGLYCLDGALMPGSTAAVNPALTIAAIVERCLDEIVQDFIT
ncbi:GMC oxidoreductase [Streptomyces sp. ISL-11]|uniref:GMC oxidoreductase n=1 Tax=Streptomyces sp. ISL-11 TaxID=2819174 RepID=UPI001BEA74B4|nr:GMC oxidoreductase [Streptomyces sp. ISL-11]MBT2385292.1 GMC family oxidoreductase [Streptomyces sp. ISL-11]